MKFRLDTNTEKSWAYLLACIYIYFKFFKVTIPEDIKWEDLSPRQREYYENLKREMKQLSQKKKASEHPEKELINIEPHSAYGSKRVMSRIKSFLSNDDFL